MIWKTPHRTYLRAEFSRRGSLDQLNDGRIGHAAALTHRLQAVADAIALHLMNQGRHQPGARGSQRVTQRNGSPGLRPCLPIVSHLTKDALLPESSTEVGCL